MPELSVAEVLQLVAEHEADTTVADLFAAAETGEGSIQAADSASFDRNEVAADLLRLLADAVRRERNEI